MRPTFAVGVLVACLIPGRAFAQAYYTAEELRDLGRPTTPGAAALALGGTRGSGLGDATDASFNPAALVLGPRTDAVVSIGGFRYGRDELQRTPVPRAFEDSLVTEVGPTRPIGSVAVAFRWPRVAVGASYDAVSRLDYARDVDRVRWQSGAQLLADTRQWSLSVRHDRLGAAMGAVLPGGLAAAGIEVHAARARIRYAGAGRNSESWYNDRLQTYQPDGVSENRAMLDADAWDVGLTLGAMMRPHPRVDVGVRWVHEPSASVALEGTQTTWRTGYESVFKFALMNVTRSSLNQPDVVSGGATVRLGGFRVVGEAGVLLAADMFHDDVTPTSNSGSCPAIDYTRVEQYDPPAVSSSRTTYPCWRLSSAPQSYSVAMRNGADVRAGVERGWQRADLAWWLRGGVSHEATAMLEVIADVDDSFLPPQSHRTWFHMGGGLRLGRVVTDVGFAAWQRQFRVLVDVKVATSGPSRTAYGSRR
jgi:hypothetical protein